jgi:DNA invertase Pin-like site-specific DNA recombinase
MDIKRVALYARVSTIKENDEGETIQNPKVQLGPLRGYVAQQGWNIVTEYIDSGISGAKESRPELNRLMTDARAGKFDIVLVWKFDRFARSTSHLDKALTEFKSLNISFVSITEQLDTATPIGKLVFTILGAVAEMERELIRERTKSGMAYAKKNGTKSGIPSGKPRTDRAQVSALTSQGMSPIEIARKMDVCVETVRRITKAA